MADLNKQSLEMWNAMKPMVDREIDQQTKGAVQRRKAKVTTAPSLVTKKIGVTEPFGDQYFIPYDAKVAGAKVGDVVWVEYMYGASNAFASMFAKAVEDPRSCSATLSSAGWYRVLKSANVSGSIIHLSVCVAGVAEVHDIDFCVSGTLTRFTNELSVGNQSFVDKIRFTTKDTLLYIDVHYNSSSSKTVNINFEAFGYAQLGNTTAESLQSVADAPAGETVLSTFYFNYNTEGVTDGWHYTLQGKHIRAIKTITDTLTNYTTINGFFGYYIASITTPFTMASRRYYVGTTWSIGNGFSISAGILAKTINSFNAYALSTASGSQDVELSIVIEGEIA